jgi:multicomponent Na+:H+ antiporter subunit E
MLLSGHTESHLLALGGLSVVLSVWVVKALGILDRESIPVHLVGRAVVYWPWLLWEIVKANWDVAKIILDPKLTITPTMMRVKASQKTDLGKAIYANSITLTPGTLSVGLEGDEITIHALTRAGADGVVEGTMDRKVTWLENAP